MLFIQRNRRLGLAPIGDLLVEPLQGIILGEDGAVLLAPIHRVLGLLRVEAVELGLLVLARVEAAEEDVARAVLWQRGDPEAAEEVVAIRRHADADLLEVLEREPGEVVVAQVGLRPGV